ncbi:MAG: methionine gamma-lyase family protein [Peptococcaceae bacterium]|nr:methionine gamma-lyase family protein [Peptococcaceae bacterium]
MEINRWAQLAAEGYGADRELLTLIRQAEKEEEAAFREIDEISAYNQLRLLQIFQEQGVTDFHLGGSTGYGYGDVGREVLERVFAAYFGGEAALVRCQILSGTHALAAGLFGNLKRGDELVSAVGTPYDTMLKVIGLHQEEGSLTDSGVSYKEVPLTEEGRPDTRGLGRALGPKTKVVLIQRSKGYQWRASLALDEVKELIDVVRQTAPQALCLVDNCYCEMVDTLEPGYVGADLVIGSLIKNPGGTLAPCGGYIVGREEYVRRAACRLAAPGLGADLGASLQFNRSAFQGFFQSPLIVAQAVKGARLAARVFSKLGYEVLPSPKDRNADIVQAIKLGTEEKLLAFCRAIQKACPLDAGFVPEPDLLPGYDYPVIMAGGTFIQGSSIELSADGPLRPPYIVYLQGGIALGQIRLGVLLAAGGVSGKNTEKI